MLRGNIAKKTYPATDYPLLLIPHPPPSQASAAHSRLNKLSNLNFSQYKEILIVNLKYSSKSAVRRTEGADELMDGYFSNVNLTYIKRFTICLFTEYVGYTF